MIREIGGGGASGGWAGGMSTYRGEKPEGCESGVDTREEYITPAGE